MMMMKMAMNVMVMMHMIMTSRDADEQTNMAETMKMIMITVDDEGGRSLKLKKVSLNS